MDKGQIGVAIVMCFVLVIHGGLTYLIVKKKKYSLLSGFANRPEQHMMRMSFLIERMK